MSVEARLQKLEDQIRSINGRLTTARGEITSHPVSSVFTRTGAVAAAADDYTWAQVNKATSSLADITTRAESDLTFTDITTNDASTTKHGFLKKLSNTATNYLDGTGTFADVTDADLSTSDIATNDASTTKHGFLKKLDNTATNFMNGTGAWSAPAGGTTDRDWDTKNSASATYGVGNGCTSAAASGVVAAIQTVSTFLAGTQQSHGIVVFPSVTASN